MVETDIDTAQQVLAGGEKRCEEMQGACISEFLSQVFRLRDGGTYKNETIVTTAIEQNQIRKNIKPITALYRQHLMT